MAPVACIGARANLLVQLLINVPELQPLLGAGRSWPPPLFLGHRAGGRYLSHPRDRRVAAKLKASSPVGGHTTEKSSTDATQAENLPRASTDINILTSAVLALQKTSAYSYW